MQAHFGISDHGSTPCNPVTVTPSIKNRTPHKGTARFCGGQGVVGSFAEMLIPNIPTVPCEMSYFFCEVLYWYI